MTTFVKTIAFGPATGGSKVTPDRVDSIVNEAMQKLQRDGARIRDVKVSLAPVTPGNFVTTFVILYDADKAAS